ncbi:MAG: YeeE/YedE family protein [Rhodospirillaceae bacterium]|nr:YeeE/YedE family protein [Rhodospirillaceae bacterium]
MQNFTPVSALAGGALIGLASAIYVLALGRVAGVSGVLGALFKPDFREAPMQIAFLAGLIGGPLLVGAIGGQVPAPTIDASMTAAVAGGLLVGFGTRLGGGCTSGHGVCGIARFSARSMVATGVFMAAGAAVVFVLRHAVGG